MLFAFLVFYLISGFSVLDIEKGKPDERELKVLLRHMMRKEKVIFTRATELAGLVFVKPLTVVRAVDLKNLLRLPMAAFRRMSNIFLNLGYVRLFPSELKMKQLLITPVSYLHEVSVESMILQTSGSDKKIIHAPVLRTKHLLGYVSAVFNKFNEKSLYFLNNRKIPVIPSLFHNNKFVTDFKEKAELFNSFFAKQCSLIKNDSKLPPRLRFLTDKRLSTIKFVDTDILKIIRNLNPNKAHGHDKISIQMLKICDNSICRPLELIFNDRLANGIFPSVWKKSNIVPVHKKNDKQRLNNY